MNRLNYLEPIFVEFIPEQLESGIIYISLKYSTVAHLCCCGCGKEVITPLNPAKWRLTENEGHISLSPSIGNWSFPCKSHYWILKNKVVWASEMSSDMISAVQASDLNAVKALVPKSFWMRLRQWINNKLSSLFRK